MPVLRTGYRIMGMLLLLLLCVVRSAHGAQAPAAAVLGPNQWEGIDLAPMLLHWEDVDGQADWHQANEAARQGRFRPLPSDMADPNFGLTRSAYWFRIHAMSSAEAETALLEVGYAPLDSVSFYVNGHLRGLTGDRLVFSSRAYPHRHFVLPLQLNSEEPVVIDVRVSNTGNFTVPLKLWSRTGFELHNQRTYALLAVYFGVLAGLAVYNLLLFLSLRSSSYLLYALFVLSMGLGQGAYNGFGAQYLSPDWPSWNDKSPLIGFTLAGWFGMLFAKESLETARHLPLTNRWMTVLAGVFAVACVCLFLGWGPMLNRWIFLTALLAVVTLIVVAWQSIGKQVAGAEVFLLSWGILALGIGIVNLRNLGWMPNNPFTQYALQWASAIEMLLLSFALAHRIHSERRLRELAQGEALRMRLGLVHALENKERELEQLVQERTTKLKQAHEALSRREHEMRELAYHDGLTGLANRKLLEDRFNQAVARAQRSGLELVVMVIDLDRFKPINDIHGHAAGDEVLKALAQRMSARLRQSDTLARIGGDEFVVLLTDLTPGVLVNSLLDSLEAVLCTPVNWHGVELRVSGSIGCARYPHDSLTLQHLLNQADVRMYAEKQARHTHVLAPPLRPPEPHERPSTEAPDKTMALH